MPRNQNNSNFTTIKIAEKFDSLMPLLSSMFHEFQELSKKKPDGVLNKCKIAIVNRLLREIHGILAEEPTSIYLDILNEDDLPQNSDVVLILSLTVAAMKTFENKYKFRNDLSYEFEWSTDKL